MKTPLTPDAVTRWLFDKGHDRAWLAKQLVRSSGTVNNWFSQGFPSDAQILIRALMVTSDVSDEPGSLLRIAFSWDDMEMIHQAAALTQTGLRDFILKAAKRTLSEERIRGTDRAAEDSPKYEGSRRKRKEHP